jgi:hypothetical protein
MLVERWPQTVCPMRPGSISTPEQPVPANRHRADRVLRIPQHRRRWQSIGEPLQRGQSSSENLSRQPRRAHSRLYHRRAHAAT